MEKEEKYQEKKATITIDINPWPQEIIKAMRQAVEECDIAQLTGLIVQVEKIDSTTARGLQALADRYDYAKLGQWLEKEK